MPPATSTATLRGKVAWFDDDKGYGFIRPETACACSCHNGATNKAAPPCVLCSKNHPQDIFVHFSAIDAADKRRQLLAGQIVEYTLRSSDQMRPYAGYVRVVQP